VADDRQKQTEKNKDRGGKKKRDQLRGIGDERIR